MAYRDMPDLIVPAPEQRCEAMTQAQVTYQEWRRKSHRCVRRATQGRDGRSVCRLHANLKKPLTYTSGEPDEFKHKRFWR